MFSTRKFWDYKPNAEIHTWKHFVSLIASFKRFSEMFLAAFSCFFTEMFSAVLSYYRQLSPKIYFKFSESLDQKALQEKVKLSPKTITVCHPCFYRQSQHLFLSRPIIKMMLIHTPDFNPPIILLLLPSVSASRFLLKAHWQWKIVLWSFLFAFHGRFSGDGNFFRVNWCFEGMFH